MNISLCNALLHSHHDVCSLREHDRMSFSNFKGQTMCLLLHDRISFSKFKGQTMCLLLEHDRYPSVSSKVKTNS